MEKKRLRKIYKDRRKELGYQERDNLSEQIFNQLQQHFDLSGKWVSIFLPIERFQEVNTWKIIDHIKANYVLPVVQKESLKHILFESKDQLKITDWGIPEPQFGEEVDVRNLDVVLVPLLAIDERGYRVGYGKGFYDGFLKQCKDGCQFIGLGFFDPVEDISDLHEADIPLHYYITPKAIHTF